MTGSRSISDRKKLLNHTTKIIFNSHWSRKRFLEGIEGLNINSEKIKVIYQSTSTKKVPIKNSKIEMLIFFENENDNEVIRIEAEVRSKEL